MLLNPYRFAGLPSALLTGLISYWKLDEASGNALDSHGTNHLTDTNTVGTAAGKVGTARDFIRANTELFAQNPAGASLALGDVDFALSCWVRAVSLPGSAGIVTKAAGVNNYEFFLFWDTGTARLSFAVYSGGTGNTVRATNFGVVPLGTWLHIVCWHDAVNNQTGIAVNDGTPNTTSWFSGMNSVPTAPFVVGAIDMSSGGWNGQMDEVGFWKRMLTPAERTQLYNAGNGLAYPFT